MYAPNDDDDDVIKGGRWLHSSLYIERKVSNMATLQLQRLCPLCNAAGALAAGPGAAAGARAGFVLLHQLL